MSRMTAMAACVLAGAGALLGGCQPPGPMTGAAYLEAAKKIVTEIPPEEAAGELARKSDLFLLDVSEFGEYEEAHIKGAILIPRGYLEFKIARNDLYPSINRGRVPKKDRPILLYCTLGSRSALAARTLGEMGYADVRTIKGGLKAWMEAGLPVEKRLRPTGPATGPAK